MAAGVGWAEMRVSGARGGSLTQPQDGIELFAAALLFAWGLSVVVAVFVLRHSVDERRLVAAKARTAGLPEPATPLDHLAGFAGRAAGKAMAAAHEERARKDRAATR